MSLEPNPRSCDRCHALKERCLISPGASECNRCIRLHLPCRSNRPVGRPGRKPKPLPHLTHRDIRATKETATESKKNRRQLFTRINTLPSRIYLPDDISDEELWMMNRVISDDNYVRAFVLGSTFCDRHREATMRHFMTHRDLLQDVYIACALLWNCEHAPTPPKQTWLGERSIYRHATVAVANLRSFRVSDEQDMATCLVLGGCILSMSHKLSGSRAPLIAATTLELIKPLYETKSEAWMSTGFLTCVASFDTFESLFRGRIPTLRVRLPKDTCYVDRVLGVSMSLLPHVYDLSVLSSDMLKPERIETRTRLRTLGEVIRLWRPEIPGTFTKDFTTVEICHMLCQAHVLQAAALLILNRLQQPFGIEDALGLSLASGIFAQLDLAKAVTGQMPLGVDVALLVACLERPQEAEERLTDCASSLTENLTTSVRSLATNHTQLLVGKFWYEIGEIVESLVAG